MDANNIVLLILDVDGVLTDGRITLGPDGDSGKGFCVQDGCAIKLWQRSGGRVAILSGRKSPEIGRRAAELEIEQVFMGIADKPAAFDSIIAAAEMDAGRAAYVGDDLPDLGPMSRCGFAVAVANAVPTVKRAADYVTRRAGGFGAVAETIELLLRRRGDWQSAASVEARIS